MCKINVVDHGDFRKLLFDDEVDIFGCKYCGEYDCLQSSALLEKLMEIKGNNIGSIIHVLERVQNPYVVQYPILLTLLDHLGLPEIARIDCQNNVELSLRSQPPGCAAAGGANQIIDYGCGYGPSALALGKIFFKSKILGIDLQERNIQVANMLVEEYDLRDRVRFLCVKNRSLEDLVNNNTNPVTLVLLKDVVEHIHPNERQKIIETLFSFIEPGGYLVIIDTPNALFPVENHTTQLPLISYFPIDLKVRLARALRPRFRKYSKERLIFDGIVGSSIIEIRRILDLNYSGTYSIIKSKRSGVNRWFNVRLNRGTGMHKLLPLLLVYKILDLLPVNVEYFLTEVNLVIRKNA